MIITRVSVLTGCKTSLDLPVTQAQLDEMELPAHERRFVQDIFPNLSAGDREFIKTGITQAEWEAAFPEQDA